MLDTDDFLDDRPEVLTVCGAEGSGDIFPNEVSRSNKVSWYVSLFIGFSHLLYNADLVHKKTGALSGKAGTLAGHTKILARAAAADYIHRRQLCSVQLCDIPHMDHIGESQFCHLNGKRFDFTCPYRHDTVMDRSQWKASDSIKKASHTWF